MGCFVPRLEGMTTTADDTTTGAYADELPVRLRWAEHAPEVYKAMIRLDTAAKRGWTRSCTSW